MTLLTDVGAVSGFSTVCVAGGRAVFSCFGGSGMTGFIFGGASVTGDVPVAGAGAGLCGAWLHRRGSVPPPGGQG